MLEFKGGAAYWRFVDFEKISTENPCGKKQKQKYESKTDKQWLGNTKGCKILCEGRSTAAFHTP